jgi:hypothetical protein
MKDTLIAIIDQLERQHRAIGTALSALRSIDAAPATAPQLQSAATPETPVRKRRPFSAATKRRMKAAQQLRWAKAKGQIEPAPAATSEPPKAKRQISEEGRKRIIAATKKRWRLQKAAAKAALAKKAA